MVTPNGSFLTRVERSAAVLALLAGGWWFATHGVGGTSWHDVGVALAHVGLPQLLLLASVWIAGLLIYAGAVLSSALPGLGIRRGLLMNLTGSAVANVVPLGGAAATALNWRMVRAWGHSNDAFLDFCITTNVLDVASKLILPVVAVGVLVLLAVPIGIGTWLMASGCLFALAIALTAALVLRNSKMVERVRILLCSQWHRLVPGSIGYLATQMLLLDTSLRLIGLRPPLQAFLMAAAVERLSTLVPVTPGGSGLAELGAVAWLVGSGLDPVKSVAGVLLYRCFVFAAEIPLGGIWLGGWAWWRAIRVPPTVAAPR